MSFAIHCDVGATLSEMEEALKGQLKILPYKSETMRMLFYLGTGIEVNVGPKGCLLNVICRLQPAIDELIEQLLRLYPDSTFVQESGHDYVPNIFPSKEW